MWPCSNKSSSVIRLPELAYILWGVSQIVMLLFMQKNKPKLLGVNSLKVLHLLLSIMQLELQTGLCYHLSLGRGILILQTVLLSPATSASLIKKYWFYHKFSFILGNIWLWVRTHNAGKSKVNGLKNMNLYFCFIYLFLFILSRY